MCDTFLSLCQLNILSGCTATNEKTMKVPLANIELAASHEEQQKASGRLYSVII